MSVPERFHSFLLKLESPVQTQVGKALKCMPEEITNELDCFLLTLTVPC